MKRYLIVLKSRHNNDSFYLDKHNNILSYNKLLDVFVVKDKGYRTFISMLIGLVHLSKLYGKKYKYSIKEIHIAVCNCKIK